jgi:hypothetical protein
MLATVICALLASILTFGKDIKEQSYGTSKRRDVYISVLGKKTFQTKLCILTRSVLQGE